MIEQLVLALMVWIAARSELPLPEPPVYQLQSAAAAAPSSVRGLHLPALPEDGAPVVLPPGWRPDDAVDQSILLHDLVHHMQARAGARYRCPGEREAEAYRLQIAWLEAHGIDFFVEFDVNPMFLMRLQRCPGDFNTTRQ